MVRVKHAFRRFQIPQPTSTGAGTAGQLFLPAFITIYIKSTVTIAIGVNRLTSCTHHTVGTVFLIKGCTSTELHHIGRTYPLSRVVQEVATIQVDGVVCLQRIGDVDYIVRRNLCSTGDFCRSRRNKYKRLIGSACCRLCKGIGIPIMIVHQGATPFFW